MADLGKTDAQHLRFDREMAIFGRLWRESEDVRRRYTRDRVQIKDENDYNSNTATDDGAITLAGVHYGTNTSEEGILYVRITGGPTYTVSLYTASGASGLVAQGTATAGNTATLSAQNSSGLTGTYKLAGSVTTETDDIHQLRVEVDWPVEETQIWDSDATTGSDEDPDSRGIYRDLLNTLAGLEAQKQAAITSAFLSMMQDRGQEFLASDEDDLLTEDVETDDDGAVSRTREGLLVTLFRAWADETTGSTQDVVERVVAGGSGSFDSNNDGSGTVASHTPEEHCPIGTWTFTCTAGLGTDDGGTEQFSVRFQPAEGDEDLEAEGETFGTLTVGESYKGPRGFGPITLVRSLTKTNDGSNTKIGAASTITVDGENEDNTASGVLYLRVVDNGSNSDYEFYKTSAGRTAGTSSDLVAKATNIADSTASQTATARNGSGLTVTFTSGSGPSNNDEADIDLNFFNVQNSSNVPDQFTVTTTLTSEGVWSRTWAEWLNYKLNSITSGSEQIDEDILKANTRLHYVTADI